MTSHYVDNVEPVPVAQLADSVPRQYAGPATEALIVLSKLRPPVARRGEVARPGLLSRLDADARVKLVLVVAPAGWGKTSLLSEWYSSRTASRSAWLSIDQGDNDPLRFWAGLIAAIKEVTPEIGSDAMQLLAVPGVEATDNLPAQVINDFAQTSEHITVLIDNYHLITNPDIHACVEFFIEHLPPTIRLVMAARSDPALPVARFRAGGEIAEVRADGLRFSEAEASELLNESLHLSLTSEDVRVLHQRTEGWVTGLYLAGLSLCGETDPGQRIRAFAGDNRQIVDYLMAEVLDGQPEQVRSFLMRTAVLDRMSGGLCDAVAGAGGSQRILEAMERSNLFIVPLDTSRSWYRYHALFSDMLRRELERSEPGLAPLLHRRASEWHRQHGSTAEAVCHAIMACDLSDARELIATRWQEHFNQGLAETVESWLTSLSPDLMRGDTRLHLMRAWLASHLGSLDDAEPWVGAAEAAALQGTFIEGPTSIESAACMLRAGSSYMLGDLAGAEAASRRAVELEASGTRRWRLVALASLGASLYWLDREREATEILCEVIEPAHQPTDSTDNRATLWALGCMSAISLRSGDAESCERYLQKAAGLATQYGLGNCREFAIAVVASASLHEDRGELREAEEAALRGLDISRRGQARLETVMALLCLARIKLRTGRPGEAEASIGAAREAMERCTAPGILDHVMTSTQRLAIQRSQPPRRNPERRGHRPDGLTRREVEVFELIAAGKTNNEIAAVLVVSVHTVERHLQNAYRKLGVRNRGQAAAYIARTEDHSRHRY
jgi:LuxR family transcriptional regulator, maltose regulon positive regulatory protein